MATDVRELRAKVGKIRILTSRLIDDQLSGDYHSTFKGQGVEFDEVRPYMVGDDVRTIDWNVTARTGTPYIKRFSEERALLSAADVECIANLCQEGQVHIAFPGSKAVAHALGRWADNMVRRKGLKYVLVPELHKKGGIHFHGFFNDSVQVVDSGHHDTAGHPVYNLPEWTLGFTTAIELYGDYPSAVGYVTKYIGKQGLRPMGRWYYSGGALKPRKKRMQTSTRRT